jgi:hypothetical protein
MAVIVAAVEAIIDPGFDLQGIQLTTGPHAPLVIVNGPVASALEINHGPNAYGPGSRSNARIGRAIRLILLNLGGGQPGVGDKATQGAPSKYVFCVAENEAASPWEPLHVSRGFAAEESVVTVVAGMGPINVHDTASTTPEGLMATLTDTMSTLGGSKLYRSFSQSLIALGPEHAAVIGSAGWSRRDTQQYVVDNAYRLVGDARRGGMFGREQDWPHWVDTTDDNARVPLHVRAEDVLFIVLGGPGRHSSYVPTWSQSRAVSRLVRHIGGAHC